MSQPQNKKRKHQAYVVEVKDPYDTPSHDPVIKIEDDDEEKPDLWKCDDEHSKSWTKTTPEEAGTQDGRSFTSYSPHLLRPALTNPA
jgi:hypothetical protein